MILKVGKLYNKGIYLGNTKDLYVDGGELPSDYRNIFLKDDCIYDDFDENILEDNGDMLPGAITYLGETYLLSISTCIASNIVFRLEYISKDKRFYFNESESINELIEEFNEHKNSTGYPEEIRYIYK